MIDSAATRAGTRPDLGAPAAATTSSRHTVVLLAAGVVAGPLYVAVSLAQALTRPGFDLSRHSWSVLANGDLGWIQMANLILTGTLVIAFSIGQHRTLVTGRASTWAPRLIGAYGASLIGAGVFRADPVPGFPAGTPAGTAISWHGMVHLMVGAVGFVCLTVACLLLARRFAATERGWAVWTAAAGVTFLGAFVGIASGAGTPATIQTFVLAVIIIWTWFSTYAVHLIRAGR